MKKHKLLLILALITLPAIGEIPSVKPLMDHLRTLPASVQGQIFVKSPLPIQDDSRARISINPDRNIHFGITENGLNVNMTGAIRFCVKTMLDLVDGCKAVEIKHVSWTPEKGFQTQLEVPNWDLFGMIESKTKKGLEEALNEKFGEKMRRALPIVRSFRQSKDLNEAQNVAKALGEIFVSGDGNGPSVAFGGRVGLSFREPWPENPADRTDSKDHPVQLGNYRLGLKYGDDINASVSFYHDRQNLNIERVELSSREGININEGTEYKMAARIILRNLSMDADGTGLQMHLGASETIMGLAALIEIVSVSGGNAPSATCAMCEAAKLPTFTNEVDYQLREQIANLVRTKRSELRTAGVPDDTITLFLKTEACRITGLKCQQPCHRNAATKSACISECIDDYRQCGGI